MPSAAELVTVVSTMASHVCCNAWRGLPSVVSTLLEHPFAAVI